MKLSWPYHKHPYPSVWGPVTSQANFCEEDFILTGYIAEVVNTLTNLTYISYALYGILANHKRHDSFLRNLPYLGIAGVGIGSAIFHSTLKNYTQWCDDLSMLIATATVLHRVFTFDTSMKTTVISGVALTAAMTGFIVWHCVTDEIIMHSVLFGIMIALVGIKTRAIISKTVSDPAVGREVKKLVLWGGISFVSGFAIWNVDNIYCSSLTSLKRKLGMPWSFFFELHGWWHILTGIGAYTFIALVEYLTSSEAGQPLGKRFAWPIGLIVNGTACTDTKDSVTAPLLGDRASEVVTAEASVGGVAEDVIVPNGNGNGKSNGKGGKKMNGTNGKKKKEI